MGETIKIDIDNDMSASTESGEVMEQMIDPWTTVTPGEYNIVINNRKGVTFLSSSSDTIVDLVVSCETMENKKVNIYPDPNKLLEVKRYIPAINGQIGEIEVTIEEKST